MNQTLLNGLRQLGLGDKQIRLYGAALTLGSAPLPELAKSAHVQRSTAYLLADELVSRGLLQEDHKTYRKQYVAAEPTTILRLLEAKHRQLGRTNLAFKEVLPELQAAHQAPEIRPRVQTFEGKSGLLAIWKDILRERQEVLLWTNQTSERQIFSGATHELFIKERITKQIPLRALAVENAAGKQLLHGDKDCFRATRLLPPGTNFTSEVYIYGNKVAVLDAGKQVFGVITENTQIAATQRAVFELTWSTLAQ
jgi:sugar-specific transcriptional regulator TrmB